MKMFKKYKILVCALLLCLPLAAGCEEAPNRLAAGTEAEENAAEISDKYVSLEEAKRQAKELEGKMMEGLRFPDYIEMPDVEAVCEVKLTPWHWKNEEEVESAIKSMWADYDVVDWSAVEKKTFYNELIPDYIGYGKTDEETGFLYSYDSQGFFSGDSLNDSEGEYVSCIAEYDFEWGDVMGDETYQLEDGEMSVAEAVLYTEKLLNEKLSALEKNQFTYKVQHLYVMKNPGVDYYDFSMVVGRVYQDVFLDTSGAFCLYQDAYYEKTHGGNHILAIMRHKNRLDYLNTCDELLEVEETTEVDQIISPLYAAQLINERIAHVDNTRFEDGGLVYLPVQDNGKAKEHVQDIFQGVDDTTSLRPVWLFMMGKTAEIPVYLRPDMHGNSVIVDAIDGTLYYYEETTPY